MAIKLVGILLLILFVPFFASPKVSSQAQGAISSEFVKSKNLRQEIDVIKEKLEVIEKKETSNQMEYIKQILGISGDTVKYVGIIATIILPLIIFLIGFQVFRTYQFEREFRESKKAITDEYQKVIALRSESEKLLGETKSKVDNLEKFVGDLATDFLSKRTSELETEVKERTEQVFAEIKTKQDLEMEKRKTLMQKLETLDMTLTPSLYVERGIIYFDQKNWDKAIENFNKAIEQKGDYFDAYFNRGRTYHTMTKHDEALNDYEKAIEIDPNQPAAYANIGVCYREKGNYEKALQNLNKAIALYPNYEFAYLQRSETYTKMKKYDLKINDLNEIDKFKPNNPWIMNFIGVGYGQMGKFDLAEEYYQKALALERNPAFLLNLAEDYICLGNFPAAEKTANEASGMVKDIRGKILAKYILLVALILSKKEYILELREMRDILKVNPKFSIGGWGFDEILNCLPKFSIESKDTETIRKIIGMLRREINPEDFAI